jgi:energy-coupling factor transporter transmembrane protein EcfT
VIGTPRARRDARPRRRPEFIVLRLLPGSSPVHRLWAGTKLLVVVGLAVMVSVQPTWVSVAAAAAVVAVAVAVTRVPPGAVPRLPRFVWVALLLGGALTLRSGVAPVVHVAGVDLSLGGLEDWLRFTALGVVLLAAALVVGWTTPLGEVGPALARLGTPLRRLRLPVDEWVVAVGLSIRCLPLLVDELRTLVAVRRLRSRERGVPDGRRGRAGLSVLREAQDLLVTAIVVALRRVREFADAIEARGGYGAPVDGAPRPGWVDAAVLVAVTGVIVGVLVS